MIVDAAIVARLQFLVDDPRFGVKVTAARFRIGRVTLWRILTQGRASRIVLNRIAATETTETPISFNPGDRSRNL